MQERSRFPRVTGPKTTQEGSHGTGAFQPPALTLPTGGGAIRGIDEKWHTDPVSGAGTLTIPIRISPGRQGFQPALSLSYNSNRGNGPFGLGWSLALPQITRKTDRGLPVYEDASESDVFVLSGEEDLVPVLVEEENGQLARYQERRTREDVDYLIYRYRPRIEVPFARMERWTNQQTGQSHWRSISRDNVTTLYGLTDESRIADPDDPLRIFSWLICESFDDRGNAILYRYKQEDLVNVPLTDPCERNRTERSRSANRYLKRVFYGNRTPLEPGDDLAQRSDWLFDLVFDYGENHLQPISEDEEGREFVEAALEEVQPWPVREDRFSSYRAGFEVRTYRLCRRILLFHHFPDELDIPDYLVSSTHFEYDESSIHTRLTGAFQSGYLHQREREYEVRSLPPLEFQYSQAEIQTELRQVESDSLENLPEGLAGERNRWVDLDGEGVSGILTEQGGGWYYKANLGGARFAAQVAVTSKPSLAGPGRTDLLDLAGDGQLDLVVLEGATPGFYERTEERSWSSHRAFESVPAINWRDANLRFVDLTGDGHADLLISEDHVFTWYPSLAEEGFAESRRTLQFDDEEKGPRLVLSDSSQSIYLADMSGDGLVDLVRIRNGEVCYWPSLGHGRFGVRVNMNHAPWFDHPDRFDQGRVRLVDVDGSGITDIVYLHADRVSIYFNESGNGWSPPRSIEDLPTLDDLSEVTVTDLFGNGTACLIWSSTLPGEAHRSMSYIDLMGGNKPHLMTGFRNNLGIETRVEYAASTRFYLEDRAAGRPWITRLPFPVQVVERIETIDHISRNRFVTRYRYHHGYFDGIEREFRGFGMVEQLDTEEFAALVRSDLLPDAANIDEQSHVPPVLTRSWFHTGAYVDNRRISGLYENEYYRPPGLSDEQFREGLLLDTMLPEGLSATEEREAVRALKGSLLRQEVYGLDGSERESHPYSVLEQNFTVKTLQSQGSNHNAVHSTHPHQVISYQYERRPEDPRISHNCVLATDDFGNVLQSVAIAYGRRQVLNGFSPDDHEHQGRTLVTYIEDGFTNPIDEDDAYRTPLSSLSSTYEIHGLQLQENQVRFNLDQLLMAANSSNVLPYHGSPIDEGIEKRLLKQTHSIYRRDDLAGPLQPGELQSRALSFETYQLAFTPEHLDLIFGERITEGNLAADGGYVHFDDDGNWWIPSGQVFLSPNQEDDPGDELLFARQHFFTPHRYQDGFGQMTTVQYDGHDLFVTETVDPLQNRMTAHYDYRVLAADQTTDANGNQRAVAFDILGMVSGTAIMGKEGDATGDSLDNFDVQLTQAQLEAFLANPAGPLAEELLGNATSRVIYDELRFQRHGQPIVAAFLTRENHINHQPNDEPRFQTRLVYSDGFGRSIQTKLLAEPGPIADETEVIDPRWTSTGWTIFNNKGQPVRQYEPFFSGTHAFQFEAASGVSSTLFYDPAGRATATLHPDHTWEKTEFDPWRQEEWDANDTLLLDPATDPIVADFFRRLPDQEYLPSWHALRTDPTHDSEARSRWPDDQQRADQASAAEKTAEHSATPFVTHFDPLGRPFLSISDNGSGGSYANRVEHDIEGRPLRAIDARGNQVRANRMVLEGDVLVPGYDMAGRALYEMSMDAGERRMLPDVMGNPILNWDARGHRLRSNYDQLQRPTELFVSDENDPEILTEKRIYGESHANGESLNLRGRLYQVYDGSGVVTHHRFDVNGNLTEISHRLAVEYRGTVDWSILAGLIESGDIEAAAMPSLEAEALISRTHYDAVNRPTITTFPDDSTMMPLYNQAGFLEQLAVRRPDEASATLVVADIDYNARGQHERILYATEDGSDLSSTFEHDPETFRLIRARTVRRSDNRTLQDLHYTYDPVGNISSIRDHAQQTVFFANSEVAPHQDFRYDPIYRLIQAEGREHTVQNSLQRDHSGLAPVIGLPFPNSPEALQRYTEEYTYDEAGNILRLRHIGGAVQRWTRRYLYADNSNRLLATSQPGDAEDEFSATYDYDPHGNTVSMPHLTSMEWSFKDQLSAASQQEVSDGTSETTYYLYSAQGERIRKVTDRQAVDGAVPSRRSERICLGNFEIYREYQGDGSVIALERHTIHLMIDNQRIAQLDTRTAGSGDGLEDSLRFVLNNHLGSAVLELDGTSEVVSYEEYHPFGTTAYRAARSMVEVNANRVRFAGKELDGETGFYYFGARYYVPWLARWISADPAGAVDGFNEYAYVRNNPVTLVDPGGLFGAPPDSDLHSQVPEGNVDYMEKPPDFESNITVDDEGNIYFNGQRTRDGKPIDESGPVDPTVQGEETTDTPETGSIEGQMANEEESASAGFRTAGKAGKILEVIASIVLALINGESPKTLRKRPSETNLDEAEDKKRRRKKKKSGSGDGKKPKPENKQSKKTAGKGTTTNKTPAKSRVTGPTHDNARLEKRVKRLPRPGRTPPRTTPPPRHPGSFGSRLGHPLVQISAEVGIRIGRYLAEKAGEKEYWEGRPGGVRMSPEEWERRLQESAPWVWPENWTKVWLDLLDDLFTPSEAPIPEHADPRVNDYHWIWSPKF